MDNKEDEAALGEPASKILKQRAYVKNMIEHMHSSNNIK